MCLNFCSKPANEAKIQNPQQNEVKGQKVAQVWRPKTQLEAEEDKGKFKYLSINTLLSDVSVCLCETVASAEVLYLVVRFLWVPLASCTCVLPRAMRAVSQWAVRSAGVISLSPA